MRACIRYMAIVKSATSRKPRRRMSAKALAKDVSSCRVQEQRLDYHISDSVFQGSRDFMKTSLACWPVAVESPALT